MGQLKIVKTYQNPREQEVLVLIHQIIKKANLKLSDIKEIKVNAGPGSFTGTRVGIAVANALAWSLGIKVNGQKLVSPKY